MQNRDAIAHEIMETLHTRLTGTLIQILQIDLADMQPPEVIVSAQEAAKKREIEIQQAEADKLVKLTQAEAALQIAASNSKLI